MYGKMNVDEHASYQRCSIIGECPPEAFPYITGTINATIMHDCYIIINQQYGYCLSELTRFSCPKFKWFEFW